MRLRETLNAVLSTPYGEAAYAVTERLTDAGRDAWWVGGCVRQMLSGEQPKDIDIASDATPEQALALFGKTDTVGKEFGSVRVRKAGFVFEVTTFREDDAASDGRHPESVRFGTREGDAQRRDFTVNAMYLQPVSGALFDPFGGQADLQERLIRFIGEPEVRIRHDALRILRAVRLRAALGGQYHPDTYRALQELSGLTEILSGQRVLGELEKMLAGPRPDRALEDLWELRVLERVLPELHACKGVAQPADYHKEGDVWDHVLRCAAHFQPDDDADVRLAAVFHDCGKPDTFSVENRIRFDHHAGVSAKKAAAVFARLQMPAKRIQKICWMIEHHMMMGVFADMPEERKGHWYHHPWFLDLTRLMRADIAGTEPSDYSLYAEILRDRDQWLDAHPSPEKPLLAGDEVMEILGIPPGAEVGRVLQALQEAQARKEVRSKEEARAFLREWDERMKTYRNATFGDTAA